MTKTTVSCDMPGLAAFKEKAIGKPVTRGVDGPVVGKILRFDGTMAVMEVDEEVVEEMESPGKFSMGCKLD